MEAGINDWFNDRVSQFYSDMLVYCYDKNFNSIGAFLEK